MSFRIPNSIIDWRRDAVDVPRHRALWEPLEDFFELNGYILWHDVNPTGKSLSVDMLAPPPGIPSTSDKYAYATEYNRSLGRPPRFTILSPVLCAARTKDGLDVLIRMLCVKGNRVEEAHLDILFFLESLASRNRTETHFLPLLETLTFEERLIFGVFPLMSEASHGVSYWVKIEDVIEFMVQAFEAVACCHRHRIAHRDLAVDNFLINHVNGPLYPKPPGDPETDGLPSLRRSFPVRFYLIDFEYSVMFNPESDIDNCTLRGYPIQKYSRDLPPEVCDSENKPYCPFKVDIWQLGHSLNKKFRDRLSPRWHELFDKMIATDPSERPTARSILLQANLLQDE